MKRSDFITMMAGAPFLGIHGTRSFPNNLLEDKRMVESPEKRLEYTWQLLNKLCTNIGPRPTGSRAFVRGTHIIKREMKRSLPLVEFDQYKFEKWELIEEPKFIMGMQRIEIMPAFGSKGTPPEGIMGILEKDGNRFKLVDASSGKTKAIISIAPYGKAIPSPITENQQTPLENYPPPSFSIGKQDIKLVKYAVREKIPTKLKMWVRRTPNALGQNVIGRLPGKKRDEILFVAHADTVYSGPGAIDNTASVIVMLMLAHAALHNKLDHTLTFVATDGEEFIGYGGSTHYAEKRMEGGTIRNIDYVVNFDSLAWGRNLQIHSKHKDLKDIIRSIHHDLKIKANPKFDSSDGFVMDSEAFRPSGAKALYANSRGYNQKTLPNYHRPTDKASNVPLDCTEVAFVVFEEFIKRIDKL